jgi:hypothetical protein
MRAALLILIGLALSLDTGYSRNTEVQPPVQELGTAVYFVPKQHADPDMRNHGHGFVTFVLQRTDENNLKPSFIAHSATAFISRYRRLPRELQQYGIWLTLQENNPYSPEEKAMLEELKSLCRRRKWPLLIHTGREDRGWQRFSSNFPKRSSQAP